MWCVYNGKGPIPNLNRSRLDNFLRLLRFSCYVLSISSFGVQRDPTCSSFYFYFSFLWSSGTETGNALDEPKSDDRCVCHFFPYDLLILTFSLFPFHILAFTAFLLLFLSGWRLGASFFCCMRTIVSVAIGMGIT